MPKAVTIAIVTAFGIFTVPPLTFLPEAYPTPPIGGIVLAGLALSWYADIYSGAAIITVAAKVYLIVHISWRFK